MKNFAITIFVFIVSGLFLTACQQNTATSSQEKPAMVKKSEKLCERLGCHVTYHP